MSRPARGAWVEIFGFLLISRAASSRAPQGARGLKSTVMDCPVLNARRAPQGARGLKYHAGWRNRHSGLVAPRKGRVG